MNIYDRSKRCKNRDTASVVHKRKLYDKSSGIIHKGVYSRQV